MKLLGIMIRRKKRTNQKQLNKEILNLHRKIKKKDSIITYYCTEKDFNRNSFHTHILIEFNNEINLYNQLNRFIGSNYWTIDESGLDTIKMNNGKWGEIHTHNIYDKEGFQQYMNKFSPVKTLY